MKNSKIKKLGAVIFACFLLLSAMPISAFCVSDEIAVWDGSVAESFGGGSGTEEDPYVITNASELAYFAKTVNEGTSYSGQYIKLTSDIVLNDETFEYKIDANLITVTDGINTSYIGTGKNNFTAGSFYYEEVTTSKGEYSGVLNVWDPIGYDTGSWGRYFSGHFDGDNHTVIGLYGSNGLFGYIYGGTVKNIRVEKSLICGDGKVGAIAGTATAYSTIENAYNFSIVMSKDDYAGGIVGYGKLAPANQKGTLTITNCANEGYIICNGYCAGGILGGLYALGSNVNLSLLIENSYNRGFIRGSYSLGGFIGYLTTKTSTKFVNCYSAGRLLSYTSEKGAFVGSFYFDGNIKLTIEYENCYYQEKSGLRVCYTSGSKPIEGVSPLTLEQLKSQESYVGFDFDTIWEIDPTSPYPCPTLRSLKVSAPKKCIHSFSDETIIEATCEEQGLVSYTCYCGYNYEWHTNAIGHNYSKKTTYPTCTEQGYITHTCKNCGDTYVDNYLSENGHNYISVITEPTCVDEGYTTYTCDRCKDSYVDDYVPEKGHTEGEWTVVTEPKIGVEGLEEQCCSECGEQIATRPIEALPGYALGDVNGDNEIDKKDYALLKRYCFGTIEFDEAQILAADVNGDGEVDKKDYALLKRHCFGTAELN